MKKQSTAPELTAPTFISDLIVIAASMAMITAVSSHSVVRRGNQKDVEDNFLLLVNGVQSS